MPEYCLAHKNTLYGEISCPQCDAEEELIAVVPEAIKALYLRLDIITIILQNIAEALHVSQEHPDDTD
jgi:hypothetical protein